MEGKAIDRLRDEHRSIERVVAAMILLADRVETGRELQQQAFLDAAEFMKLVRDAHEQKEEQQLFPVLQRRGIALHSVPTRMLIAEHQRAKALVARLQEAMDILATGDKPEARNALVSPLRGLGALYPLHIWQEDLLLFHQADRALDASGNRELLAGFDEVDNALGESVRSRLEHMAERVERESW